MFPSAFTEDSSTYVTKFEIIFERIIFYCIWEVLTWFMGSLNALLWFENVLKCVKCVENPLPSYCDTQYFTLTAMDNFDNANKNILSRLKHAHNTALTVFQIKPKTWKSKPTTTSIVIPGIKSSDKLKCQEVKKSVLTRSYHWRGHFKSCIQT